MRFIALVLILLAFGGWDCTAQEAEYRDTVSFDFPQFRNEIFVNLNPAFIVMLGGENIKPRYSLGFQRFLKPNLRGRVWANYKVWENIFEDKTEGRVVPTSAATVDIRTRDYYDYSLDLRVGMSVSKPNQRISADYGFDVFGGIRSRKFVDLRTPYELDTAVCHNCFVPSSLEYPTSTTREEQYAIMGMDFSIGALFKAGNRMWLSLQWTPQLSYSSLIEQKQSDPNAKSQDNIDGLNFNIQGIELFCSFRF